MPEQPVAWPAELDALIAAPQHHHLMMENEQVRVLETRIGPGETVPLHTHCWPSANHILSVSEFIRRDANGDVLLNTLETKSSVAAGQAIWQPPLAPHTLENVGERPIHLISVEIKRTSGA